MIQIKNDAVLAVVLEEEEKKEYESTKRPLTNEVVNHLTESS